jgi:hypothetical protein
MQKYILTLIIAIGTGIYPVVDATGDATFRCSNRVICIGDSAEQVLAKCSQPNIIDRWEDYPHAFVSRHYNYEKQRYEAPRLIKGPIPMEQWTYHLGPNRFVRYLFFENQKLIRIETGPKLAR